MRWLAALVLLAAATAPPALAHPEDEAFVLRNPNVLAMSSADYVLERMVQRGVIEVSWHGIAPSSATLRSRNGAAEWVVVYRNNAIADPAHRTLYIVLTTTYDYIAANYTGQ